MPPENAVVLCVELHLVMDDYAAHKRVGGREWSAANPRVQVHFTPTSGGWLHLVEVWFGIIERQATHRGTVRSVTELNKAVHRRLERTHPPVRVDQDRRAGPEQGQP